MTRAGCVLTPILQDQLQTRIHLPEKLSCFNTSPDGVWAAGGSPTGHIYLWEVSLIPLYLSKGGTDAASLRSHLETCSRHSMHTTGQSPRSPLHHARLSFLLPLKTRRPRHGLSLDWSIFPQTWPLPFLNRIAHSRTIPWPSVCFTSGRVKESNVEYSPVLWMAASKFGD